MQERLLREHPSAAEFARDLASTHNNMGQLLAKTGHPAGALRSFETAREIQKRLVQDDPTVTELAESLATTLTTWATSSPRRATRLAHCRVGGVGEVVEVGRRGAARFDRSDAGPLEARI